MSAEPKWKVDPSDVKVLRGLAARRREIAGSAENLERIRLWKRLNSLKVERPMVVIEPYARGLSDEVWAGREWRCREEWARDVERALTQDIRQFEEIRDDTVYTPFYEIGWDRTVSEYGVEAPKTHGQADGAFGSYVWAPPIKDIDRDFAKLRPRAFAVDREATLAHKARLESVFGDLLAVRVRGNWGWSAGLTWDAVTLVGLENLMLLMYDNPQGLHRLMRFLCDDQRAYMQWTEREGLLDLNNESDYIGSGSVGFTDELPQKDYTPGAAARLKDRWMLLESQETVGVGPDLFAEFIFPYQKELAELAGLVYYGCCEPVHTRWHVIRNLPRLRKVSISPWCDEDFMAEALGANQVFCRKPKPTLISTEHFDEGLIRADLAGTLSACKAHNCPNLEFSMKDVHTVNREPARLARWVAIAREEIAKAWK